MTPIAIAALLALQAADPFAALLAEAKAKQWASLPIGERVAAVGKSFIGIPYVAHTLEVNPHVESCTVNLAGLDCVTFFETSLGFARMLGKGGGTFSDLVKEVSYTRYRGGKVDGYASRLHYTSEWMVDNDQKGTVSLLSPSLPGSAEFTQKVGFMSANPDKYPQLAAYPDRVHQIRAMEDQLNSLKRYYVPLSEARKAESKLKTGDIIGITTSAQGLDCSHTGMIVVEQGVPRFMHASSAAKKVVLDGRLSDVLSKMKNTTGFMAVRPR